MVAALCMAHIDLEWAENQYWCTLLKVIREMNKLTAPKEKKKVSASDMQKHIKD